MAVGEIHEEALMPHTPETSALVTELWAEMKKGRVYEADLREKDYHLDGICEGGKVYVNPAPGVVEALIHELLHRARPRWGERRVLRVSRDVLLRMDEREIRRFYRTFQRTATKRTRPVRLDE